MSSYLNEGEGGGSGGIAIGDSVTGGTPKQMVEESKQEITPVTEEELEENSDDTTQIV